MTLGKIVTTAIITMALTAGPLGGLDDVLASDDPKNTSLASLAVTPNDSISDVGYTDVGYNHARDRVISQIAESTRPTAYSEQEIQDYIAVQRYFSDEQINEWKTNAIAGGVGLWDLPGSNTDFAGNPREKIIPGRTSVGAYEAQISKVAVGEDAPPPVTIEISQYLDQMPKDTKFVYICANGKP